MLRNPSTWARAARRLAWVGSTVATLACRDIVPDEAAFAGAAGTGLDSARGTDATAGVDAPAVAADVPGDAATPDATAADAAGTDSRTADSAGDVPIEASPVDAVGADGMDAAPGPDAGTAADTAGDIPAPLDAAPCVAPACCAADADCADATLPCQTFSCSKTTKSCVATPKKDGAACDDGDACTVEACAAGQCKESTFLCKCKTTVDCANEEDGDLCNGTLYCNPKNHECAVNPATVVKCATGLDTACQKNQCDAATGKCKVVFPKDPLEPCDDSNACTTGDVCATGACKPGTNTCTCVQDTDCAKGEDGDFCNGTLFCDTTQKPPSCKVNPKTIVKCPTATDATCAQIACEKATGQCLTKVAPVDTPCDDGAPCTAGDVCAQGTCKPGTNLCFCSKDADCGAFEDGDFCNGVLYCDKTQSPAQCKVNPVTVVKCQSVDDGPCAKNLCAPKTGQCAMKTINELALCDADGNPCTAGDQCHKGVCVPGTPICPCAADADCAKQEDGNVCNGTLYCNKTLQPQQCAVNPATVVSCPSVGDTACQANVCEPKNGKCAATNVNESGACSDGDKCTVGEVCQKGQCAAGTQVCACKADADCLDDGDKCNGQPFCDKTAVPFACKPNPLTAVACAAKASGCAATACEPQTGACGPQPKAGACDDKNPCTADVCDPMAGTCKSAPVIDGLACGLDSACIAGACKQVASNQVVVGAGTFWMGCEPASDAPCGADAQPMHAVTLAAYLFDRTEVTVAAYQACVDAKACTAPAPAGPHCTWGKAGYAAHPVGCVSHTQAAQFCTFVGRRLPTEAEWERAARVGCGADAGPACKAAMPLYPWGNDAANCGWAVMQGASKPGCDLDSTRPVGAQASDQSAVGAFDLGGNLREWVADGYDAASYATATPTDPKGPATATQHVVRGGGLLSTAAALRTANRQALDPAKAAEDVGFRCAQTVK